MHKINSWINHQIMGIYEKTVLLDDLNYKIKKLLPEHIRAHCFVGSFNKGALILMVSNAIFASELRYLLPDLRDSLRTHAGFHQLVSIKVEIMAELDTTGLAIKKGHLPRAPLSAEVRKNLSEAAEVFSYPPLKALLSKMAHGEGPCLKKDKQDKTD